MLVTHVTESKMVDMGGNGRSLGRRNRYVIALTSAVILAVILASCVLSKEEATAQSVVDDFVNALNEGDAAAAAAQTSYPNAAETAIQQMFDGLKPEDAKFDLTQFMDLAPTPASSPLVPLGISVRARIGPTRFRVVCGTCPSAGASPGIRRSSRPTWATGVSSATTGRTPLRRGSSTRSAGCS